MDPSRSMSLPMGPQSKTHRVAHVCARQVSAHCLDSQRLDGWFIIPTNGWAHRRLNLLGPTNIYIFLTHVSLCGNNLHTASKDPTMRSYFPYMGREALRFRSLKLQIFSTRKALAFMGSLSSYTPLYKHQTSPSLRYVKFLPTLASLSSERFFYH